MVGFSLLGVVESTELTGLEDLLKVELLAEVSDVDNTISFQLLNTVTESSDISGIVVEATVRFLDDQRDLLLGHKNADGSVIFNSELLLEELIDEGAEHGVVKRLANLLKLDVEAGVDLVKLNARDSAEHLPSSTAVLVSTLELHDVLTSTELEGFFAVVAFLGVLVEFREILNVRHFLEEVGEGIVEFSDEHTELSSPIADVVVAEYLQALELENTAHAVTLDGGSQVTNMHVFSNIGRREINNNALFFNSLDFLVVHSHGAFHCRNFVDEILNEGVLELHVEEESRLGGVSLTHLGKLNALNGVIVALVDLGNHLFSHFFAGRESVGSVLLGHVVEFHGARAVEVSSG